MDISNNILVPVNFDPQSIIALEQSYNLARLMKLDINLVYVFDEGGAIDRVISRSKNESFKRKIENNLTELAQRVNSDIGVKVIPHIITGKTAHAGILDMGNSLTPKFILISSLSSTTCNTTRKFGSTAKKIIQSARYPVISINGKEHFDGCRKILLPLDLSHETRQKVTGAIEFAKYFKSEIKIMSVLLPRILKSDLAKMKAQLKQVSNFIKNAGINCQAELVGYKSEFPSEAHQIVSYAEDEGDIDLIMIMTQKEKNAVEFFLGSNAEKIIRFSDIPVMSILPKQLGESSMRFL